MTQTTPRVLFAQHSRGFLLSALVCVSISIQVWASPTPALAQMPNKTLTFHPHPAQFHQFHPSFVSIF